MGLRTHAGGLILVFLGLGPHGHAAEAVRIGQEPVPAAAPPESKRVAARGGGLELSFDELDTLLLARHGGALEGRQALRELLERRVLERLAASEKVEISAAKLNQRWKELDQATREQGEGGLEQYLAESKVDPAVFRELLRLSLVQEVLARRALGIPEPDPVTPEQQTMWLAGVLEERGYAELPRPWAEGVVARCGDAEVTTAAFAEHLRDTVSEEALRSACHELLLERRIRARMPDLAPEAFERAVTDEIDRRRADAEANPEYKGLPFEQLLAARGLTLEQLKGDPAIRIAALSQLWAARSLRDEDLRAAYESERESYDGRFGEGVAVAMLQLNAAERANQLVPRTFEEAEQELVELRARIGGIEDFMRLAREKSEHVASKSKGGQLGVLTRGSTLLPPEVRDEVFRTLETKEGNTSGTILGPLRAQGACLLLCLGARRPAPTWEEMSAEVARDLRRRFLDDCLARESVELWRDET